MSHVPRFFFQKWHFRDISLEPVSFYLLPTGGSTRIALMALKFMIYIVPTKASLLDGERPDMSLAWDISNTPGSPLT